VPIPYNVEAETGRKAWVKENADSSYTRNEISGMTYKVIHELRYTMAGVGPMPPGCIGIPNYGIVFSNERSK